MSKIGLVQNCLEEIFDEFTPKFVNKMHWIQLQYRVEKKQEDFSACKGSQERSRKRNSEKCHVCDTTTRLGFSVSVSSRTVSNPRYLKFLE